MGLAFKKQPRERGLAGVAYPYPPTHIKLDGREVGQITKNYRDNFVTGEKADDKYIISLTIEKRTN